MKRENEVTELLISNAIHLIAEGGFEKATTKELTHYGGDLPDFKMNEVYIYRIFGSKEKLFATAFARLEAELYDAFLKGIDAVKSSDKPLREQMYDFFLLAWRFILRNEERCRCYVRYYYSIYFGELSLEPHNRLFESVVSALEPLFKEEAHVFSIFHSIFITLLDFAIRVYDGALSDDEDTRVHTFNVLYCMMSTYLK